LELIGGFKVDVKGDPKEFKEESTEVYNEVLKDLSLNVQHFISARFTELTPSITKSEKVPF
jgi:hypothetical protein